MLINSRTIWDGPKWLTVACFLGDFGLQTVLHFTQASHKKACQPNFDYFVCLPLLNEESILSFLHFDSLQTWENCHRYPSRPHHHLPWVLLYTQNHPTLGQWDPEWHFHPGVSSGRPLETRTPVNIACVKELIEQNPRRSTWEASADPFLPHTAVYEILKKYLMWVKWSSAVGCLTSSQRGTRRREWCAVRRWLCCTRPMDSCFLPPIC